MIIWSFYTIDTPYEAEAERLEKSLRRLVERGEMPYRWVIQPVANLGDWQLNVKQRPALIRAAMERENDSILAVDCDATFENEIDLDFDSLECDLAANVMDKAFWKQETSKRTHSLMAGTLYFPNTDNARMILKTWEQDCPKTRKWDQRVLEPIARNFRLYNLPVKYCAIDKTMWGINDAVIRHHQASRRLRKKINAR